MSKADIKSSGEIIFNNIALMIPKMYLPSPSENMTKWAAVACDQYTSQPEYWKQAEKIVGSAPSTLKLMLPEIYLDDKDVDEKIGAVNENMRRYISDGILKETEPCMMLVKRATGVSPERTGIVAALDLEKYSFEKGSGSLIRATEGTVTERIPPRMKIRKNAMIELPHIMILIDDPELTAIEPVSSTVLSAGDSPLYDFELMMNGGSIKGWKITDSKTIQGFSEALERLASPTVFSNKYNVTGNTPVLLYAVGDGNHSLASAKCHWEELKSKGASPDHPARFALVEIVNVHDNGIVFEPIHRVIFNVCFEEFIDSLLDYFKGGASYATTDALKTAKDDPSAACHAIPVCSENENGIIYIDKTVHTLAVGAVQTFINSYASVNKEIKVDYIHGDNVAETLGRKSGSVGIMLPPMSKSDLFLTVIKNGSLPRKTFSMGEAFEKRYYIECRKIAEK